MDLFALTRRLVDIESITPNEGAVGDFLCEELRRRGFESRKMVVEGVRANVLATWAGHDRPEVFFSTHMDTVPPFIASSEDEQRIYGRGACDAKGIIAAQILAAERLRGEGFFVGLLFLVGEETNSVGASKANQHPMGARFMINGEPTDNRLALATKGSLHVVLTALGKMAHSAYPDLGRISDRQARRSAASFAHHETAGDAGRGRQHEKCGNHRRRPRAQRDSRLRTC